MKDVFTVPGICSYKMGPFGDFTGSNRESACGCLIRNEGNVIQNAGMTGEEETKFCELAEKYVNRKLKAPRDFSARNYKNGYDFITNFYTESTPRLEKIAYDAVNYALGRMGFEVGE